MLESLRVSGPNLEGQTNTVSEQQRDLSEQQRDLSEQHVICARKVRLWFAFIWVMNAQTPQVLHTWDLESFLFIFQGSNKTLSEQQLDWSEQHEIRARG